jgi:hypothetical protein
MNPSDKNEAAQGEAKETATSGISRRSFLGASSAVLTGTLASGLVAAAPSGSQAMNVARAPSSGDGRIRCTLNGLELEVSERTGGLTSVKFDNVGMLLRQTEESASLLTMRYPVKGFIPLMLESRLSQAHVLRADDRLSITWERLIGNRSNIELPPGRVRATVTLRAAPDARSVILRARVENHSQGDITELLFPDLSGLRPIDEPELMELRMALGAINPLAGPVFPEGRTPAYYEAWWDEYQSGGGYNRNALRWMDYGSLKGGFGLFEKAWLLAPRANILMHRDEADPDELRIVLQHSVKVRPGEVWESQEHWLTPHVGGWANGIQPFRDYVRAVNPPRTVPVPKRVREGVGFQTIWMMQNLECDPRYATFRFSDFGRIARDAKAHGISEIVVWGWCNYMTFPITLKEGIGSVDDMIAGIRDAREAGVNISLFVSLKEISDQYAKKYGLKPDSSRPWSYHPEMIPVMLPDDAGSGLIEVPSYNVPWQKDVFAALTGFISKGVTSFGWDVYNDNGGTALVDLIHRIREKIPREADGSFCGEVIESFEKATQVLDYTWLWDDFADAGPYTATLGYPRINANIQSSARVTKMAFADNLYINAFPKWPNQPNGTKLIGEEPELSAALREVALLRSHFLEYFTDGDYLGESVLVRPVERFVRTQCGQALSYHPTHRGSDLEYPPVMVRGYRLAGRLLIIVLNNEERSRQVTIECNLPMWLPGVKTCRIKAYNGRAEESQASVWKAGENWSGRMGYLRPLELAFFEISAA